MRRLFSVLAAVLTGLTAGAQDYASYVNPLVGTDFHGHTFPGAAYPFGMMQLSPDTRPSSGDWDGCSGYHYSDSHIYGFSHTHLSGTGCDDLCDVLVMPVRDYKHGLEGENYRSAYSHFDEKAEPGYYEVFLDDPKVRARMTVGRRSGIHEYSYEGAGSMDLIIDLKHRDALKGSRIAQVDDYTIEGYRISRSWADHQHVHFYMVFDRPITGMKIFAARDNAAASADPGQAAEAHGAEGAEGVLLSFGDGPGTLTAHIGISSVSEANARANLIADGAAATGGSALRAERLPQFGYVRARARGEWNRYLGQIEVSGGYESQMRVFYTSLYHTAIHPSLYSDANGEYRGMDDAVHSTGGEFERYTIFSIWDTFRALHPLFTLIERERTVDFLKTFLSVYDEGGRLPMWELYGYETDCMIGFNAVSVITDAFVKGIDGFDYGRMFDAMVQSARRHGYGVNSFFEDGAVLADKEHESVSKTLEYAYDSWCVYQMATYLQSYTRSAENEIIADEFYTYAQQWKNLFDPSTGFMRPRLNGRWLTPFNPREVNNHFTEANSWQYSFFVPHDVNGHIKALGGDEQYCAKLDALFTAPEQTTGRTQADITGLIGQYAHGNEPSHHIPYLYLYAGQPWKTQERVRQILETMYSDAPDGLCGNEDCGQMSAWYVLSSLGIYNVCPGSGFLCLTTPLFPSATIHITGGKDFHISSSPVSREPSDAVYIASAMLDGKRYTKSYIDFDDILAGKTLEYRISSKPSAGFGVSEADRPHAELDKWIADLPAFVMDNDIITGPAVVTVSGIPAGGYAEYAVLYGTPEEVNARIGEADTRAIKFSRYEGSITVTDKCSILAHNVVDGQLSNMIRTDIKKVAADKKIKILSHYNPQYNAGGDEGLIDEHRGTANWRTGGWQGYQDTDFTAVVDLLEARDVTELAAGFCQDARSWIWMPRYVEFYVARNATGADGWPSDADFQYAGRVDNTVDAQDFAVQVRDMNCRLAAGTGEGVRFVKVFAKNFGAIPDWHPGAGSEGFIFVDEIIVR